jgi:hypothetical protein
VIVHLVLFRLRPNLTDTEREGLLSAFQRAVQEIPSVVRATIGPRVLFGTGYERANADAFPYMAALEFSDLSGLQAYLHHSAHAKPARLFFEAVEASTIADYHAQDLGRGLRA